MENLRNRAEMFILDQERHCDVLGNQEVGFQFYLWHYQLQVLRQVITSLNLYFFSLKTTIKRTKCINVCDCLTHIGGSQISFLLPLPLKCVNRELLRFQFLVDEKNSVCSIFKVEIQLIDNIVLFSGVQQSDSDIFFRLIFHYRLCKIFFIVPCAIW